jgi:cyclic-di-GMP phosphodiesterase TipF (flagellum assembly factor)
MIRLSTIFTAVCMVLIAASLGVVLNTLMGLGRNETAAVSFAAIGCMLLYSAAAARLRKRGDVSSQLEDISRGTTELAHQVADIGRRLTSVESKLSSAHSVGQDRMQSVIGEIGELGTLLQQLAGSVAHHEDVLSGGWSRPSVAPPPAANAAIAPPQVTSAGPPIVKAPPAPHVAAPAGPPRVPPEQMMMLCWQAVEAGRIDIYLQPTVTLPQRKVSYYEAVSRIRDENDRVIAAEEFVAAAEAAGLIARIDHAVIMRAMQVLRRLIVRNEDVSVFCNVSSATIRDAEVYAQLFEFLDANRAMAKALVLEFRQSAMRDFGPIERDRLLALHRLGYNYAIDHVTDLKFDPRDMAERGIRYVKVPASLLLAPPPGQADIAPADLSDLFGRFAIQLIAERIEGEGVVADLLDYNVRFGQGFVFSAPRPLRPESSVPMPPAAEAAPAMAPEIVPAFPMGRSPIDPRPPAPPSFAPRIDPPQRLTGNAALVRRAGQA